MNIKITNLSKNFGFNKVLKNINLRFEKGKIYGVIGDNGSGKTTLFRCIAGLEKYEGKIISDIDSIFHGESLSGGNPENLINLNNMETALKDYMGLLFTEPYFFPKITGREHIRFLCNARKIDIGNIDDKNIFDLPLDDFVWTYSSGMKKKLALLALLLQNNQFILLDEPFNGLDIHSCFIVVEIIKNLRSLNKIVVISSHIFSTMSDCCDEIYLLEKGEIIKTVSPDGYVDLENEMKIFTIGNKIEKLGLK
ncbi:MAG: ABC transporter ATP-binding protein [Candidatus Cloacimonetes bacterium]|nr:ABC transporter ATP-binding protein [Candidatus Cloacimonadota bacterium]